MSQEKTTREILIDSILELAGDELDTRFDLITLAKASEKELTLRLFAIANYYKLELEKLQTLS